MTPNVPPLAITQAASGSFRGLKFIRMRCPGSGGSLVTLRKNANVLKMVGAAEPATRSYRTSCVTGLGTLSPGGAATDDGGRCRDRTYDLSRVKRTLSR